MNTPEKIEAASKKKEEGNTLFKAGKYERASKRYEKVYFRVIHTSPGLHWASFELMIYSTSLPWHILLWQAVKFIEYDSTFSDEEKKQAKSLKVTCNLNNAACKLKLKDYKQAEKLCTKVLELDSNNVKALYRRAQAYIQLVDLDLAEIDIKKALEIDPHNRYLLVSFFISDFSSPKIYVVCSVLVVCFFVHNLMVTSSF